MNVNKRKLLIISIISGVFSMLQFVNIFNYHSNIGMIRSSDGPTIIYYSRLVPFYQYVLLIVPFIITILSIILYKKCSKKK